MNLLEVFDNPLVWEWETEAPSKMIAQFDIDDENQYEVRFMRTQPANEETGHGDYWTFWFNVYGPMSDDKGEMGILNKGLGLTVFATVKDILRAFMEARDPYSLMFTAEASEPSRVKLYNRFLKSFKSAGYEVDQMMDGNEMRYWVKKQVANQ